MSAAAGIDLLVDLSALVNSLGAADALVKNSVDPGYTNYLMGVAHNSAEVEFNTLAAAKAATGSIAHMYEWGTQGINKGRSNMRPNPMDPRARLWRDYMIPTGLKATMGFTFTPSIAIVPKPTSAETGMKPEVIQKLSDHIFVWKARVMEQGETVHIRPKNGRFLLIPRPRGWREYGRSARGYLMLDGTIRATPGAKVSGNFTQFWTAFWESQGQTLMEHSIVAQMEMDFAKEIEVQAPHIPKKPVTSIKAGVQKKSAIVRAETKAKARTRKRASDGGK